MKKIIFIFSCFILFCSTVNAVKLPVDIEAKSAILINLDENEVIYEKNADGVQILASLTKIMTVHVALQNIDDITDTVKITEKDWQGIEGMTVSKPNLAVGEKVTYEDLLYWTMLWSAADTAQALGNNIGGTTENFVKMMNKEAKRLKLRNTHFEDTFGGHDDNIGTARELGILLTEALKDKRFEEIFKTTIYHSTNGSPVVNSTKNYAIFHGLDENLITGNKTGYTPEAGLLIASTATIKGTEYLTIVMNSDPNAYMTTHVLDTYRILDYVKTQNYKSRTILEKDTLLKKIKVVNGTIDEYPVYLPNTITKILSDEDYQKVKIEYNIVDKIDYTSKVGDNLGFVDVIIDDEVIASESIYLKDKLYETNDNTKQGASLIIPTIALAISFFFVVLISTKLFFKQAKKKKKKKSKK